MNPQQPENILTTPKVLHTDFDQNDEGILLTTNTKRQLFKNEQEQSYKSHLIYEKNNETQTFTDRSLNPNPRPKDLKKKQTLSINTKQFRQSEGSDKNYKSGNLSESQGQKEEQNSFNSNQGMEGSRRIPNKLSTISNAKLGMKKVSENINKFDGFSWMGLKKRIDSLKQLMRNMELSSMVQIRSKLKTYHLMIIDDKGSNQQFDAKQTRFLDDLVSLENFFVKLSQFFYQIFKHFPSISSTQLVVILFKIILALQLMYQLFQLPFMVSFPDNSINLFSTSHGVLRFVFTLPFIFEIILNFNMKYFEHGDQISDKAQIVLRYVKKEFWWDVAGVIGTGTIEQNTHLLIILLIFFIRFMKFKAMYNAIEEKFQLSLRFTVSFTLINLFLTISILAHVFGCIFQYIGISLHNDGWDSWLDKAELIDKTITDKYVAALYFSFITMISVGYGDITPINNIERVFVTFMTVFSCGTFAYVVNTIGALFEQLARNEAVYRQQRYEISNYMSNRNIDSELQTKVFQYLEMLKLKKEWEPESGQNVIEIMNPKLKESIYQNYYGRYLKSWALFSKKFSTPFLELLSIKCKEQVFGPGETIYYQQEHDLDYTEDDGKNKYNQQSQSIYLIVKGKVLLSQDNRLMKNSKKQQMNTKTKYSNGESIGVKEFFCGQPYEYTASSKGLTTVIKIQRSHFLDVIKRFPKDYETFSMIRDELVFIEPDRFIKCQPCQRYDHSTYQCPRMHYLKQKQKSILKYLASDTQERKKIERIKRQKVKATGPSRCIIKQKLKLIRVDMIISLKKHSLAKEQQVQQKIIAQESINVFSKQAELETSMQVNNNIELDSDSSGEEVNTKTNILDGNAKRQLTFRNRANKLLSKEEKELIESTKEGQDEFFYFKCPLIYWNEDKKCYEISPEIDENEGNLAIQQYIEQNFQLYFSLHPEANNQEFLDFTYNPSTFGESFDQKGGLNNMLSMNQSPSMIGARISPKQNTIQINKNQTALNNIIEEENLILMSQSSLSLDEFDNNGNTKQDLKSNIMNTDSKYNNSNTKSLDNNFNYTNPSTNNNYKMSEDFHPKTSIFSPVQQNHEADNNLSSNNSEQTPQFLMNSNQNSSLNGHGTNTINQNDIFLGLDKQNDNPDTPSNKTKLLRQTKHFQTFKQLKTLLSLSLDYQSNQNKASTPKSVKPRFESDQVIEEEEEQQQQSKIKIQSIPVVGNEIEEGSKKEQKNQSNFITTTDFRSNQRAENNSMPFRVNSRTQTIRGTNMMIQPLFSNERLIGNVKTEIDASQFQQNPTNVNSQFLCDKDNAANQPTKQPNTNNTQTQQQQQQIINNQQYNTNIIYQNHNLTPSEITELQSFIFSFEKPTNFTKYFPKGNMVNVIKKYIKYQDQFTFQYMNHQIMNQRTGKIIPRTPKSRGQKQQTKREVSKFSKKL